ncbi:hypothetical protein TIFTF001_034457 [Ficus carica]|uniref:Uncharacterized protein n=1 Tax=Ficus carica TaxID=3494 RepID=A0AA88DZY1_FICCA|nr:hypothetical protein TIFTF001_034457 [Ficus carica]
MELVTRIGCIRSLVASRAAVGRKPTFKDFQARFRWTPTSISSASCTIVFLMPRETKPKNVRSNHCRKISDLPPPPIRFLCLFGQTEDHLMKSTPEMGRLVKIYAMVPIYPFCRRSQRQSMPVNGGQTSQLFDPVRRFKKIAFPAYFRRSEYFRDIGFTRRSSEG